jgi:2-succinyl-5-enolpyruvyl-6-hydroxy-3-cyclohexene-1-carboxylate synthase
MTIHNKQHISLLPSILKKKGVEYVVISPGSRNAPLIQTFYKIFKENCISIVDERSAAYYALGISIKTQKPAVVITTSGTAALNLAPAIAEAYHQMIPLIAITADRPPEWIDQQDNQAIVQQNIFASNCKAFYELPVETISENDYKYAGRLINEAYNKSITGRYGPVHINVPLREPLYDEIPILHDVPVIEYKLSSEFSVEDSFVDSWNNAKKIMIVCGQLPPNERLSIVINQFSFNNRAIVMAEPISNIKGDKIISIPDLVLSQIDEEVDDVIPDLLIYFGGQVVSKRLKALLRKQETGSQWYVDPEGKHVDTFQALTHVIKAEPLLFFESLNSKVHIKNDSHYSVHWQELLNKVNVKLKSTPKELPWSDLLVFSRIVSRINKTNIVFAGNSSVIRYLQMFPFECKAVYSNRGTSGIDGCLSTAAGVASTTKSDVYVFLGDVSFLYDSNALWNKNLPPNLKIIVINNEGGGIFELIDGPSSQSGFKEFFKAHHPVNISELAKAFGIHYYQCIDEKSFDKNFNSLKESKSASLMEIKTPGDKNPIIFRNFIKKIKI